MSLTEKGIRCTNPLVLNCDVASGTQKFVEGKKRIIETKTKKNKASVHIIIDRKGRLSIIGPTTLALCYSAASKQTEES